MNVLIIGLGFVGNRFLQAFKNVSEVSQSMAHISFAYVDKRHKTRDIPYFDDVEAALSVFKPHIVVVAVNDEVHGEILAKLKGFSGFLICEKPLIGPREDAQRAIVELSGISGFAFDLTARYSAAVTTLKSYVATHGLQLIRGNFYWGKDRINDYRPTCGVISEIIHPLDLVRHICNPSQEIQLRGVLGTRSDFSVSV